MRVLVTGHRGYIGSVLVGMLHQARFDVVGLDSELYHGCDFGRIRETIPSFEMDLRDVEVADLVSFDAVVHLASLPAQDADPVHQQQICNINLETTIRLADCCKKARVARLLFASTCGVYEKPSGAPSATNSTVAPENINAMAKLLCERELLRVADRSLTPLIIRQADVYGVSPRLRLDGWVNQFVASAVTSGTVTVPADGAAWRPFVHVEDLSRVYASLLLAPLEGNAPRVFPVVEPDAVHRLIDLADIVTEHIPRSSRILNRACRAISSYRADWQEPTHPLPRTLFRWTLPLGIRQLRYAMEFAGLTPAEVRSDRYHRTLRLNNMLERGLCNRAMKPTSLHAA